MSKKTRKEKILAEQRKRKKHFSPIQEDLLQTPIKTPVEKKPYPFFMNDFRKSLIIISGIITLEIIIYFARIKGMIRIYE